MALMEAGADIKPSLEVKPSWNPMAAHGRLAVVPRCYTTPANMLQGAESRAGDNP